MHESGGVLGMSLSDYFGTLKMASRLLPKLKVSIKLPTKTRFLPFTAASLHPVPFVILSPFFAF